MAGQDESLRMAAEVVDKFSSAVVHWQSNEEGSITDLILSQFPGGAGLGQMPPAIGDEELEAPGP